MPHSPWKRALIAGLIAGGLAASGSRVARAAESDEWLTGPALRQQLAQPVKLAWTDVPLRKGLADLSRSQRVAILLDRRVDPGTLLGESLQDVPLEIALERLARSQQLGVSWYGPLVYLGPPTAAHRLRTLAALRTSDAKSLPTKRRLPFTRQQPWRWEDFVTPRELIESLAAEAKIELSGTEQIPHDLWAAADLPPLSWVERLTLIANEFDLTFEFDSDGGRVTLIETPSQVTLERSYAAGKDPQRLLKKWAQAAPNAQLEAAGEKIIVRGTVEDHEMINGKSQAAKPAAGGTEVYTLAVRDQPLGPVLKELGQRLALQLHIDEPALKAADISLDRRVSFSVDKVSLDELFQAALEPAGLMFRRRDKTLDIYPAPK